MSLMSAPPVARRPYIGGQAVIEGVMMRAPRSLAIVLRRRSGQLVVRERKMPDTRKGVLAWPLVRGVMSLVEALRLGTQALRFSADYYERDLELAEQQAGGAKASRPAKTRSTGILSTLAAPVLALMALDDSGGGAPSSEGKARSNLLTWVMLIVAVGVFVALPQVFATGTSRLLHIAPDIRSPGFQLLTGGFKLCIVVGYMLAIRHIPDIYRVFQYHGAEHKAIAAYEAELDLTVDNARSKSRLHPRCGTSFLVMVVLVSILVFTAIGPLLPHVPFGGAKLENVLFFLMKLPALPVIAAITFELQRLTARFCLTGPLRFTLYPGFAVQLITTIEPDDSQIEVALASLRATLWREQSKDIGAPDQPEDRHYQSFAELMAQPAYGLVSSPSQQSSE